MKILGRATLYVVVLTVLLGGVYPAAVTAVSRVFWKEKADGSFVTAGGRVVGSELIGQAFARPEYLHPRPSAAGKTGYDATASGGTNKGPTDADLAKSVAAAVAAARADRPGDTRPVPADLVTSSGSGLDPHLSPDAAEWQARNAANILWLQETFDEAKMRHAAAVMIIAQADPGWDNPERGRFWSHGFPESSLALLTNCLEL